MASGGQCVMIAGTSTMPTLCVDSWVMVSFTN